MGPCLNMFVALSLSLLPLQHISLLASADSACLVTKIITIAIWLKESTGLLQPGKPVCHRLSPARPYLTQLCFCVVFLHAFPKPPYRAKTSLHWGLSPGPSVYRTDALPLSYRGLCVAKADASKPQRICACQQITPPVGLEPTIFGLEVRRLVH